LLVILLMAGFFYGLRRFGGRALGAASSSRGRQPRLGVIDSAMVDARRRLLLIRRDNVEHLIMTGGPTDIVIEPNIVRATRAAPAGDGPAGARPGHAAPRPRGVRLAGGGLGPLQPDTPPAPPTRAEPMLRAEPPPRPPRAATPPPPPPAPKSLDEEIEAHRP